jgi:hypothetical protein
VSDEDQGEGCRALCWLPGPFAKSCFAVICRSQASKVDDLTKRYSELSKGAQPKLDIKRLAESLVLFVVAKLETRSLDGARAFPNLLVAPVERLDLNWRKPTTEEGLVAYAPKMFVSGNLRVWIAVLFVSRSFADMKALKVEVWRHGPAAIMLKSQVKQDGAHLRVQFVAVGKMMQFPETELEQDSAHEEVTRKDAKAVRKGVLLMLKLAREAASTGAGCVF